MMRKNLLWLALLAAAFLPLGGCGSNSSSGGDSTGQAATAADPQALFAGSEACQTCHQEIYANFVNSGHPYKLNKVVDGLIPTYPFSTINGALEAAGELNTDPAAMINNTLGFPADYSEVSYVIGGYGWKARWIDADGYIVKTIKDAAGVAQYNLEDGSYVSYDGSLDTPYNCGNCHTTGWQHQDDSLNPNRQDDLPGMDGTFVAGGIQCESCHGAGKKHISTQEAGDIVLEATPRTTAQLLAPDAGYARAVACSECHTRDGEHDYPTYVTPYNVDFPAGPQQGGRIDASGGLGKHHQQYDELLGVDPATGTPLGKHVAAGLGCVTCHDPHKTIKYADQTGDSGLYRTCDDCHGAGKALAVAMPAGSEMAGLDCEDCHMPNLAKSAIKHDAVGTGPATGDIASHIFKIDLTQAEQVTADGKYVNPWITKGFACGTCHNGVDVFDVSALDLTGYTFHKPSEPAKFAGKYAGSELCGECHETNYADFIQSGHPYKLNKVKNDTVPAYPFSDIGPGLAMVTDEDGVTDNSLGTPTSYADISYVIGGYGWKARWIDADGYIVTGSKVQYNLNGTAGDDLIVAYHDGDVDVPYNCGNCHTTGWQHYDADRNPNRQDDLPGMDGTFVLEGGVHCESCHGAGLLHVVTADKETTPNITKVATARSTFELKGDAGWYAPVTCSECHTRDGEHDYPSYVSGYESAVGTADLMGGRIIAKGGFAQHHEQFDELLGVDPDDVAGGGLGKHLAPTNGQPALTCVSCHSPHKTTRYQDDPDNTSSGPGVEVDCDACHTVTYNDAGGTAAAGHAAAGCVDCHMPKTAKSAIKTDSAAGGLGADSFGDIRSHIFKIDLTKDPDVEQFNKDTSDPADGINEGGFMYPWQTHKFACGYCHSDTAQSVTDMGGAVHATVNTFVPTP